MTKTSLKTNKELKIHEVIKIKAPIVEALKNATDNPTYQFHIPGHTKGKAIFSDFKKLIGEKALNVDTTDAIPWERSPVWSCFIELLLNIPFSLSS